MFRPQALLLVALAAALPSFADEGMWTYDNFPADKVKAKYGFEVTPRWLEHVRLSSARFGGGCSASFVSPDGLVMTNHHCARRCINQLSTPKKDLIKNGFYARAPAEEQRCPALELNQLVEMTDVTARVQGATRGLDGKKFQAAQRAELARIEKECTRGDDIRCDAVSLYQGGQYHLYKYRRFHDVRLVFAPEQDISHFGGDPDNFEFPRYSLDVSFLRAYEGGKPAKTEHFFRWSEHGAREGELVFVTGNPGKTSRLETIAALKYQRDYALPERLIHLAELRGMLNEFASRGPEHERISHSARLGTDNAYKALTGRRLALVDDRFFARNVAQEKDLRDKVNADPEKKRNYGAAWDRIAAATRQLEEVRVELNLLEHGAGGGSELFSHARTLLRAAEELPKPNGERLREFADARLPGIRQRVASTAPLYPELETALFGFYLTKLRERLGPDHPVVREVLGKSSPESLARRAVIGSKLRDPKLRTRMFEGGAKAVAAANDPMISLARALDDDARKIRQKYEDEIEAVLHKNQELIAKARFELYGTSTYPDATGSARLSYGTVRGYVEDGKKVEPITDMGGTWARATGEEPFALPPSWIRARQRVDPETPMNFASDNDIIGGNSGSPVINRDAEIVGLVFDGNIQSLGGEYGFDESVNRTVSVHSEAILEALDEIYGAQPLLRELGPRRRSSFPASTP